MKTEYENRVENYITVKGTQREFNIRWWGWGISAFLVGIAFGITLGVGG